MLSRISSIIFPTRFRVVISGAVNIILPPLIAILAFVSPSRALSRSPWNPRMAFSSQVDNVTNTGPLALWALMIFFATLPWTWCAASPSSFSAPVPSWSSKTSCIKHSKKHSKKTRTTVSLNEFLEGNLLVFNVCF